MLKSLMKTPNKVIDYNAIEIGRYIFNVMFFMSESDSTQEPNLEEEEMIVPAYEDQGNMY